MLLRTWDEVFVITDQEAAFIKQKLLAAQKFIQIGEYLLNSSTIRSIEPGGEQEAQEIMLQIEYKGRGGWKCQFDLWHEKDQLCGHTQKRITNSKSLQAL